MPFHGVGSQALVNIIPMHAQSRILSHRFQTLLDVIKVFFFCAIPHSRSLYFPIAVRPALAGSEMRNRLEVGKESIQGFVAIHIHKVPVSNSFITGKDRRSQSLQLQCTLLFGSFK